jgi:RHS repeat-associated protein
VSVVGLRCEAGFRAANGVRVKGWLSLTSSARARSSMAMGTWCRGSCMAPSPTCRSTSSRTARRIAVFSDHLGTPRVIVHATTVSVVQRLDVQPFGETIHDSNPGWQPFGFAGGLCDPDTGLVRFGARDYDPLPGRWTAKDDAVTSARKTMAVETRKCHGATVGSKHTARASHAQLIAGSPPDAGGSAVLVLYLHQGFLSFLAD